MRESITSYHCDGPDCNTTTLGASVYDIGPDEWFQLTPPDEPALDPDQTLHFCRIECLTQWASDEIAADLGLGRH